jgi:hypothetical protein
MTLKQTILTSATLACLVMIILSCNQQKSDVPGTVFIDLDKLPAKQVDLSEYLEDVYIVSFETTPDCLLGRLALVERDESDIFYLSGDNQTIYHFSATGKYLNSFCRMGKGPGEYSRVAVLQIVPGTQTILLSDPRRNKMIQYNYSGNLIKEFTLPQSTARFVVLNKNLIALHGGKMVGLNGTEPEKSDLIFMDLEGKIVARQFPFDNSLRFEFSNAFTRADADGSYYYSKQFDFNLYKIKDTSQPEIFLKFDYGKSMASIDDLTGTDINALGVLRKEGKRFSIDYLLNTYRDLLLYNNKDGKTSLLLINKKTTNLIAFGVDSLSSLGNFHGFPVKPPRDSYKTHFLSTMDAVDVYDIIHKLSADQIKILKKQVRGFDRILNIKQEDNPVLVYYKFRDF